MKHIKPPSDYVVRDYASLHIKRDTRHRLNVAKTIFQAQRRKFITQDEFINLLLDDFAETTPAQSVRELAPNHRA